MAIVDHPGLSGPRRGALAGFCLLLLLGLQSCHPQTASNGGGERSGRLASRAGEANRNSRTTPHGSLVGVAEEGSREAEPLATRRSASHEIAYQPDELAAYQAYLRAVGEQRSGPAQRISLEGEVLSLHKGSVCPYTVEDCPIEPYPDDWGTLRIDTLLSEEPSGRWKVQDHTSSAGPDEAVAEEPPIQREEISIGEGQTVRAQFLYTARPVILRWITAAPGNDDWERASRGDGRVGIPPMDRYEPLPRRNGSYLLTVGTTGGSAAEEMRLPGLSAGDRIRASATYDGVLRIRTYDLLLR